MRANAVRGWSLVHRWTSLVCTLFLLIICVTGLPLLFTNEIDNWLHPVAYAVVPPGAPKANIDDLIRASQRVYPAHVVTSVFADDDEPQVIVGLATSWAAINADPRSGQFVRFDAHTARIIETSAPAGEQTRFMDVMLRLHTDMFAGLPGGLFLGAMGLSFVLAIVSGVVLYGPFTRKLDFGEVRLHRTRRVRWLDLHNLLGITTLAWANVVGATGVMNELSTPLFAIWQQTDVAAMLTPWQGRPALQPDQLASPETALATASRALPNMNVTSIVFPGDAGGSPYHYLLWAHGRTPLTSQLFSPVLIDARTGKLTAVVRMPWYLRALEVSRPLHFGNYGGSPLKILWALLDLVTIVMLGSGLYLWFGKRKRAPTADDGDHESPRPSADILATAE
jgi:uncharacterized iron-regulated membrane protein